MRDKAKVAELLAALKAQMTTDYERSVVEECEILLGEECRDVEGYEGFYQVSDLGRVRSFQRGYTRILKATLNAHGYPFVILRKNKHSKTITVHRLIAETFIQNPYQNRATKAPCFSYGDEVA